VDGYSIYGGRADLRFVDGQTNRVVMDREMEVLDVMTANRDKRVWAVARGGDLKVDDSNTPPFIPVKTNKPGPGPNGAHVFVGGVLVAQAPDVMFLKDTDGDDKADVRVRVLSGIDSADTHHTANSFALDPGGALYFQEGTFHHTQVETPWAPTLRNVNAGV